MHFVPRSCPFKAKEKPKAAAWLWAPAPALCSLGGELLQLGVRQLKKRVQQEVMGMTLGTRRHLPGGTWCWQLRAALLLCALCCRPAFPVILCSVMRMVIVIYWPRSHKWFSETNSVFFRKWWTFSPIKKKKSRSLLSWIFKSSIFQIKVSQITSLWSCVTRDGFLKRKQQLTLLLTRSLGPQDRVVCCMRVLRD